MIYDAELLSRAWLAVASASANDPGRPLLHRTICLEEFKKGHRLIATDGYVLLHSWIPSSGYGDDPTTEPDLDEAPTTTTVAVDLDGRAKALMGYAYSLTRDEDADYLEARLQVMAAESKQTALEGMAGRQLVVELPGREKVLLPTFEGEFIDWRHLAIGHAAKATKLVALSQSVLPTLAKLRTWYPGVVQITLAGQHSALLIEVEGSWPKLEGLVMPARDDREDDA